MRSAKFITHILLLYNMIQKRTIIIFLCLFYTGRRIWKNTIYFDPVNALRLGQQRFFFIFSQVSRCLDDN